MQSCPIWQIEGDIAMLWQIEGDIAMLWQIEGDIAMLWQIEGDTAMLWQSEGDIAMLLGVCLFCLFVFMEIIRWQTILYYQVLTLHKN